MKGDFIRILVGSFLGAFLARWLMEEHNPWTALAALLVTGVLAAITWLVARPD